MLLDPNSIIITEGRQRHGEIKIDSLVASIKKSGQINPITVRKENGNVILVAGYRRLLSCRQLNIPIEVKFFEDLSKTEAEIIELEENAKRTDLHWRDHVSAVGRIHSIHQSFDPNWTLAKTADSLALSLVYLGQIIRVYKNLDLPNLKDCTGFQQAFSVLQTLADRNAAAVVSEIKSTTNEAFSSGEKSNEDRGNNPTPSSSVNNNDDHSTRESTSQDSVNNSMPNTKPSDPDSILNTSFIDWVKTYSGPKFNLIHCDFPYDVEYRSYAKSTTSMDSEYDAKGFDDLLKTFCENTEKIASYQSHLIFWFSMKFYSETRKALSDAGWFVHYRPLIWPKSDNAGIIPGTDSQYPRWTYETAFLCSRGRRPLVKQLADHYSAPNAQNPIHPSQKPEPVLRHFLGMVVDDTTDLLDPTCGSGTSLRAAEALGARSVLGLEISPEYTSAANRATQEFRRLRRLSK